MVVDVFSVVVVDGLVWVAVVELADSDVVVLALVVCVVVVVELMAETVVDSNMDVVGSVVIVLVLLTI